MKNILIKIASFSMIFIAIFVKLNNFMQPVWLDWNNYNTTHGFYNEPENTIETVFLGSSVVINGINSMQLYEEYGLSAYNLGTEQQPVLASYYWLEEVHRLHKDTLRTVVFDVSMLRRSSDGAFYSKAIDAMELSEVKYRAIEAYTKSHSETVANLIPLFSWHDRWANIEKIDFEKNSYEPELYTRGYNVYIKTLLETSDDFSIPTYFVDEGINQTELNNEAVEYFEKMVIFCKNNSLELILIKTPTINSWNSGLHNAVEQLANENGVEFLDFNFAPLIDAISYNDIVDNADGTHLNYYGAKKLTAYIGAYLVEKYDAHDVRGKEEYAFLEMELKDYRDNVLPILELKKCKDPIDYIKLAMENDNYTILLAVKDDASASFTIEQRTQLRTIGLKGLSELEYRSSYIAVIDRGVILYDYENIESQDLYSCEEDGSIGYKGYLYNDEEYILKSGGFAHGNIASCTIEGVQYAMNQRGINIVIWDNKNGKVVDSTVFDTCLSSEREVILESYLEEIIANEEEENWSDNVWKYVQYVELCNSARESYVEEGVSN